MWPDRRGVMSPALEAYLRYLGKSTFIAGIALIVLALVAPAAATAAVPSDSATTTRTASIPELTAASTAAEVVESRAVSTLVWHDARITAARDRLAEAGSARTRSAITKVIASLVEDRSALASTAARASSQADEAQIALAEAQAAEAARLRAEQVALYGAFPVAGACEYIDSWGFPRSGGRSHKGADIMAVAGTPVVAVKDGTLTSGNSRLGGTTLWLETADGTRYYYAHLESIAIGSGAVAAGQVIGYVGSTGNASASAPHLHFEIHRPNAVNPYSELLQMAR